MTLSDVAQRLGPPDTSCNKLWHAVFAKVANPRKRHLSLDKQGENDIPPLAFSFSSNLLMHVFQERSDKSEDYQRPLCPTSNHRAEHRCEATSILI
ncbi:hypothetical protein CC2G_003180 [Coprinopsis cinerea AmutBmut pab1-1]|nr:hypothetical protein CC2G_003180 [Coprinopsis cinerea AmutBmut pab1-1]